jgi:hypothetical protein
MEPSKCFDLIIESVKRSAVVISFKSEILSALEYFKTQSLCDLDRRDQPFVMRARWRELENKTQGLGLFDELKKRDEIWRVVRCFVFDAEPASLLVPRVEPPLVKEASKFLNWTPEDFFEHLSKHAERTPTFSSDESLALSHGILFLKASASLPKQKRDAKRIKQVWTAIHPLLKKLNLMDEFSRDHDMRNRIRLFVENSF